MRGLDPEDVRGAVVAHVLPKLRSKNTVDFLLEHAVVEEAEEGGK